MALMAGRALGPAESKLVETLASMDRAQRAMTQTSEVISRLLSKGAAPTDLCARYNAFALDFRDGQSAIMAQLRKLGVPGIADAPPWPPVFIDRDASKGGQLSLPPVEMLTINKASVALVPPQQKTPTDGTLSAGPLIWLGVTAIAGVSLYFISDRYFEFKTEKVQQETLQLANALDAKAYELHIEQIKWRALFIVLLARKCAGAQDTKTPDAIRFVACLRTAAATVEKTPVPTSLTQLVNENRKLARAEEGHGFLWWFGLITVTAASTAAVVVVAKKWYDRRQSRDVSGYDDEDDEEEAA